MRSLQNLRNRKIPLDEARLRTFARKAVVDNESYEWLVEATEPIEEKYTNETFAQGDRVKAQLDNNLPGSYSTEFEYQGSVTNDTHVRYFSDIDLLALHGVYTTYPPGYPIPNPVSDEVVADALDSLRSDTVRVLREQFPKASVDESRGKAVGISSGSLTRDIDVVFCNWWNTQEYLNNKVRANRGIRVLDADSSTRIGNKPFLHNWQINDKDVRVGGGFRKAIRLLKNLKYDKNPEATISSYDIAALVFRVPDADLNVPPGSYLKLATGVSRFLNSLMTNNQAREDLYVPNGMRKIFGNGGATLAQLKEITGELDSLVAEVGQAATLINLSESVSSFSTSSSWREVRAQRVREVAEKFRQTD